MPVPNRKQRKTIAELLNHGIFQIALAHWTANMLELRNFANTGSTNFNSKSYHSVVLMACCDDDGLFTMIETGYAGRNSVGGIFRASEMKHWITHARLDIPPPSPLKYDENGSPFPYYFVADEAFRYHAT